MKLLIDAQCVRELKPHTGTERYSIELSKAIVRQGGDHELWITTGPHATDAVEAIFGSWVPRARMVRIALPAPMPESTPADTQRARVAEWIRETFIADLAPDLVHLTSLVWHPAVTSIRAFERGPKISVSHYDLIPLLNPDRYLRDITTRETYWCKIRSLSNADLVLSISQYSKEEAVSTLGLAADRIVVIPGAAANEFTPAQPNPELKHLLRKDYGICEPFLVCVVPPPADDRKNTERLLRAFALLPAEARANRQLVIVGAIDQQTRAKHRSVADSAGLSDSELVITDFIPDCDLRLIYSFCELFVMPSLHEGLGLPILEAMACGAPVIGSRATSVPEIIGRADALFDPTNVGAIAGKIHEVLSQPDFARSLREWSTVQSGRFSWDHSAKLTWGAFLELQSKTKSYGRRDAVVTEPKPRLAYMIASDACDRPPCPGFVTFVRALSRYYSLEMVTTSAHAALSGELACHDIEWFEANADALDRIVYDASGEYTSARMRGLMQQWPGMVILRDLAFAEWIHREEQSHPGNWLRMLYQEDGIAAVRAFGTTHEPADYLCIRRIVESSIGIIVCTNDVLDTLQNYFGDRLTEQVKGLPELKAVSWATCSLHDALQALAGRLQEHLELFFRSNPNARMNRLLRRLATHSDLLHDADLRSFAKCISANRLYARPRLLIDAGLLMDEMPAGIPRVAQNIAERLLREPRPGMRIEPFRRDGQNFSTCPAYWKKLGIPDVGWTESVIEPARTDRALLFEPPAAPAAITGLKHAQVTTYALMYDLLPISRPDFFDEGVGLAFEQYLRTIVADVDGVICISRTVAGDLSDWLFQERITRRTPLRIGWFHLGADFPCVDAMEARTDAPDMVNRALMRPLALIVGSLEYRSDRKGYGQTIDAFELLWGRGYDVALALVGQRVSPKDKLTERITHHSEYGRLLFWFEKPSDCVLTKLYKSATVLLYPSHGEGFGLPLVEAGWHDLPIIARDLPIFREIAGDHICYFDGYGGSDLVGAIESFFVLQKQGRVPSSSGMKPLSWTQSAEQLLSIIFDDQWSTTYGPYQPLT